MDTLLHNLPLYSHVRQTRPLEPLSFGKKLDLIQLVDKFSPEFSPGALSLFHPLYFNGHLQTVAAAVKTFEDVDHVYYKRLVLNCSDGGEATADFRVEPWDLEKDSTTEVEYHPPNQTKKLQPRYKFFTPAELQTLTSNDSKPMLIVLHGLTGGSHESYVRSLVNKMTGKFGFEACVLNSRGCSESCITTPQLYNGVWTDDIRDFIKKLRGLFPHRKFYLVGFSLGASIATNYLGQEGENSEIECAAILASPWDLCNASYHMHRSFIGRQLYGNHFSKSLVKMLTDNLEILKKDPYMAKLYAEKLDKVTSVEQFDNWFTSRMFGFNGSYEYYRYGTSSNRVPLIRTPTLAISASDDPIVGQESLPTREIEGNPYTLLIESSKGGHVAWFDASGERWYEVPLCKFFSAFHTEIAAKGLKPDLDSVTLPHKNKFKGDRLVDATVRDY
ncbi:LAME_0F12244g1_1 [Lachancea meyersii CBS 8951]|uniref:LAME_0F12244g1_1 n=1 Tax=Lachancea meyersii CBS 8951 TaxID=1266667 RepID=A0A1G4JWX1_9SACH|nr:LAME_0F12244g1_1 [Lachancea meyersii CBS 8951]